MTMKVTILLDATLQLYSFTMNGGDRFLQKGKFLSDCMAPHPRRHYSSNTQFTIPSTL